MAAGTPPRFGGGNTRKLACEWNVAALVSFFSHLQLS